MRKGRPFTLSKSALRLYRLAALQGLPNSLAPRMSDDFYWVGCAAIGFNTPFTWQRQTHWRPQPCNPIPANRIKNE